jgi:hypothetical protein
MRNRNIMNSFRTFCLLLATSFLLAGCKGKKKASLSGEDPVEISDFIDFFPGKQVPYQLSDSSLARKDTDSLLISQRVFAQFVPDSFVTKVFGKAAKTKIYPLAKVSGPEEENYLFTKVVAGEKKAAYLFAFNKEDQLLDGIQLLRSGQYPGAQQTVNIDRNYSITKIVTRKNADGTTSDGKDVYGLDNETGKFMLIMTDALDDKVAELVNPIDTFSRKHKYAGDYGTGKTTLVSFRDGRKNDRLSFYIHFEKNSGACTGDLRGEALFFSGTIAEYREGGGPCVLRFTFTSSSVLVKEVEGCGSHRGLRCSFDGTYSKRKEPKPAAKKKQTKNK